MEDGVDSFNSKHNVELCMPPWTFLTFNPLNSRPNQFILVPTSKSLVFYNLSQITQH